MEVPEENMTVKEMLEKIAELDHSQSQLKGLNAEMRHWLDAADEDMATLRSENVSLKKQVKDLEKFICDAQQVESEPSMSLLNDDLDVKRWSEEKIQKLEEESNMMKEQNKKLNAELKNLQQAREQDQISLSKFRVLVQSLQFGMEEAQSGLLQRDEVIHQKTLTLKHSEETLEEFSTIIEDFRLANQELRRQLENRQEEAIFFALMDENKESLSPPVSFADEVKLLATSDEMKTSMSDSDRLRPEEAEAEDKLEPQRLTDLETKRCAGTLETAVQRAGLFITCIFALLVLIFVASGRGLGSCGSFSFSTLWTSAHLMLQPYCCVHYGVLPPI